MEISNKQSCTLDNLKPFRGGWVCVLVRRCRHRQVPPDVVKQSLSVKCCSRALKAISKGSVWSLEKKLVNDCCNRALRTTTKGSVWSLKKNPAYDCCNRARRTTTKGSVWSLKKNPAYDCCNRTLRTISKGSVWSLKENLPMIAESEPLEDPVRSGKT